MRRPSFDLFAFALGIYAGAVALVALAMATDWKFVAWVPLAIAGGVSLVTFTFTATRTNPVVWIVEHRVHFVLAFAPVVPIFVVLGANAVGVVPTEIFDDWLLPILLLLLVVLFFHTATLRRYITVLREQESVLAEWTAGADSWYKVRVRALSLIGGVIVFIGGLYFSIKFDIGGTFVGIVAGTLLGMAFVGGRRRHYILFEHGLVVQDSKAVGGRYIPVNRLRSVTRSEHALTIYRRIPWPVPFRSSIEAMQNPDTIESALREQLG